jgi:hypothetical protein
LGFGLASITTHATQLQLLISYPVFVHSLYFPPISLFLHQIRLQRQIQLDRLSVGQRTFHDNLMLSDWQLDPQHATFDAKQTSGWRAVEEHGAR